MHDAWPEIKVSLTRGWCPREIDYFFFFFIIIINGIGKEIVDSRKSSSTHFYASSHFKRSKGTVRISEQKKKVYSVPPSPSRRIQPLVMNVRKWYRERRQEERSGRPSISDEVVAKVADVKSANVETGYSRC